MTSFADMWSLLDLALFLYPHSTVKNGLVWVTSEQEVLYDEKLCPWWNTTLDCFSTFMHACMWVAVSVSVPFPWPMEGGHSFLHCYSLVKPISPPLNLIFLTASFLNPLLLHQFSCQWKAVSHWLFSGKRTQCLIGVNENYWGYFNWFCLHPLSLHQFGC